MKKLNNFSLVMGLISLITLSSCFGSKKASTTSQNDGAIKESGVIFLTQKGILSLGTAKFYSDAFLKGIHVINSQDVTFAPDAKSNVINDVKLTNGAVTLHKDEVKLTGTLKAGTAGKIDSLVRYSDTKNIQKFRVEYIITNFGSYYMWYDWDVDGGTDCFISKNKVRTKINGIVMIRSTFDNRLQWDFTFSSQSSDKTFQVLSPFGNNSNINSGGLKKVTPPKNEEEVEEEN